MYKEGIHFMDYRTILQEENDAVRERLDLSMERVAAMGEDDIRQPYGNYFRCVCPLYINDRGTGKRKREGKKHFPASVTGAKYTDFMKIFCLSTMR